VVIDIRDKYLLGKVIHHVADPFQFAGIHYYEQVVIVEFVLKLANRTDLPAVGKKIENPGAFSSLREIQRLPMLSRYSIKAN
jgi:hypothetical protein